MRGMGLLNQGSDLETSEERNITGRVLLER